MNGTVAIYIPEIHNSNSKTKDCEKIHSPYLPQLPISVKPLFQNTRQAVPVRR
jgi:hypothetical protein